MKLSLPWRQIHLDFHTSPFIGDVGQEFDAKEFARTMKDAHVSSVTVFAKCHHGHLYYNTKRPERHPGLRPGLDLLRGQVEELHRVGIRAPIYISVQCDEYAADHHPEWIARDVEGRPVGAGPLQPGWQILDMVSPYQDFLAEQTAEVLKLFNPADGIFFDMCWDQPSWSNYAVDAMVKANLNPALEADRNTHARRVVLGYMKRYFNMVKASSRDATVYFNCRPYHNLEEDVAFQTQVEIEALPTGGWGYLYFPKNVRFARNFNRPCLGMTARFHKSWADFGGLKPVPAMEFEIGQMIAHGARCSIGDQLHPRGNLDPAAYQLIGHVYSRVEALEPYLQDATPVTDIGAFQLPAAFTTVGSTSGSDEGVVRVLTQLKHQFDVVNAHSDLRKYKLLVLPDAVKVEGALADELKNYLKAGGSLLCTGTSGLNTEGTEVLLQELGIKVSGFSPFKETYIRFGKEVSRDVPATDHVMYDKGVRAVASKGTTTLARVVEPYFQRSWEHFSSHNQTPADKLSVYAAAVQNGRCAYIPFPIFSSIATHGNYPYRLLVRNLIDRLLPEPLVKIAAPTTTEVTVMRQPAKSAGTKSSRTMVHILQYSAERRTKDLDLIEDVVPLFEVPLSLRLDKAPGRVYLAPEGTRLDFTFADGRAEVVIPRVDGQAVVVFE